LGNKETMMAYDGINMANTRVMMMMMTTTMMMMTIERSFLDMEL
jgi:hypothetical protein